MADDVKTTVNPADAGQDAQTQQTADNNTQQSKSFTQEDVERIVQERLRREREKYKDYNELKKIAEEYRKIQESQMSEVEKAQMRLAEVEKAYYEKEREVAELKAMMTKQKVLTELGLPLSLADRIFGETEEEIRQDAEELKKLLGLQAKPKIGAPTNPSQKSNLEDVKSLDEALKLYYKK